MKLFFTFWPIHPAVRCSPFHPPFPPRVRNNRSRSPAVWQTCMSHAAVSCTCVVRFSQRSREAVHFTGGPGTQSEAPHLALQCFLPSDLEHLIILPFNMDVRQRKKQTPPFLPIISSVCHHLTCKGPTLAPYMPTSILTNDPVAG